MALLVKTGIASRWGTGSAWLSSRRNSVTICAYSGLASSIAQGNFCVQFWYSRKMRRTQLTLISQNEIIETILVNAKLRARRRDRCEGGVSTSTLSRVNRDFTLVAMAGDPFKINASNLKRRSNWGGDYLNSYKAALIGGLCNYRVKLCRNR
jgi:hypothetical protein